MRRLQTFLWAWLFAMALLIGVVSLLGLAFGEGEYMPLGPVGALAALALAWLVGRRLYVAARSVSRRGRPI